MKIVHLRPTSCWLTYRLSYLSRKYRSCRLVYFVPNTECTNTVSQAIMSLLIGGISANHFYRPFLHSFRDYYTCLVHVTACDVEHSLTSDKISFHPSFRPSFLKMSAVSVGSCISGFNSCSLQRT